MPAVADDTSRRGMQTLVAGSGSAAAADAGEAAMAASRRAAGEGEEAAAGGEGCCWVPYGWRRGGLRRLPPPIPSLGRLARARTSDGRLVISREAAALRVCGGKVEDRLVLGLVDGGDVTAPRRWSHPLAAQDASAFPVIDDEVETVHHEEGTRAAVQSHAPAPASSLEAG